MNKKADIEISLKTLIGFVLVGIILIAFIGFFMKMWGIFLNKPDQATINSFENLVYEINTLKEGEEKIIPFYIQKDLYLRVTCRKHMDDTEFGDDICICKSANDCYKRLERKFLEKEVIVKLIIGYESGKEVRNLKLVKSVSGKEVCIYGDTSQRGCS